MRKGVNNITKKSILYSIKRDIEEIYVSIVNSIISNTKIDNFHKISDLYSLKNKINNKNNNEFKSIIRTIIEKGTSNIYSKVNKKFKTPNIDEYEKKQLSQINVKMRENLKEMNTNLKNILVDINSIINGTYTNNREYHIRIILREKNFKEKLEKIIQWSTEKINIEQKREKNEEEKRKSLYYIENYYVPNKLNIESLRKYKELAEKYIKIVNKYIY